MSRRTVVWLLVVWCACSRVSPPAAGAHGDRRAGRRRPPLRNLLRGADGVLELGDFGIATGPYGTRLTVAGTAPGTAGYLAPEQARGEQVTAAADLYGLGSVLYELLNGEPPRRAASLADLAAAVPGPLEVRRRLRGALVELVSGLDRSRGAAARARRERAPAGVEPHGLAAPPRRGAPAGRLS